MVKPVLIEPMPVHELLVYTYNVVVGKTKAQDFTKSTPIGPRTTWTDFATDELFFVIGLFVLCHVWEVMGRAVARAGGLRRGKVDSFAASFLELGYYSLSLFCGYRVFKDTDWFWKSGWDKLMYDGRIQMTGPEMLPYAVSPDTKFVYLMEIAWYLGGFIRLVRYIRPQSHHDICNPATFCPHFGGDALDLQRISGKGGNNWCASLRRCRAKPKRTFTKCCFTTSSPLRASDTLVLFLPSLSDTLVLFLPFFCLYLYPSPCVMHMRELFCLEIFPPATTPFRSVHVQTPECMPPCGCMPADSW